MPTYTYVCKDCDDRIEVVRSFSDDPLTECPSCGGTLRQVFNAAGIIFKGDGWHIKDYAKKKKAGASAGSSAGSNGGSSATSDGGSDGGSGGSGTSGGDAGGSAGEGTTSTSSASSGD